MAINPGTAYPGGTAAPSPAYPYGQGRNITVPGDGTGTPWEAGVVNDLFGFQQALLSAIGVTPSTFPEAVGASQYLQAVVALASGLGSIGTDSGAVNTVVLTLPLNVQAPPAYFNGYRVTFRPIAANTGATTINVNGLGLRDLRSYRDEVLTGSELSTTVDAVAVFSAALNRFLLVENSGRTRKVVFTTSGNYTPSPGVRHVIVEAVGAGGGGGGAQGPGVGNGGNAGTGGCGGAYGVKVYTRAALPVAPIAVTIGAGGVGGSTAGGGGTNGGNTIFDTMTANGGQGGAGDANPGTTGGGRGADSSALVSSVAVGADYSVDGGIGGTGIVFNTNGMGAGGGLSNLSAQAHNTRENVAAVNGTKYGNGGGGGISCNSATGRAGGTGANGVCIITEIF
jgi:hypothetical protein